MAIRGDFGLLDSGEACWNTTGRGQSEKIMKTGGARLFTGTKSIETGGICRKNRKGCKYWGIRPRKGE